MYVSPLVLCNNIIYRGFRDNIPITPMKLQKLMYFVCRDYLKSTEEELIPESFGVWQYGPVLQTVYDEFKGYKAGAIKGYAKDADCKSYLIDEDQNPNLATIIEEVWCRYRRCSGIELSKITHREGSGWSQAFQRQEFIITAEDMKNDHIV